MSTTLLAVSRSLTLAVSVSLCVLLSAVHGPAARADSGALVASAAAAPAPGPRDGRAKLSGRLFIALRGLLERICARITASDDVDLALVSSEIDARERMYFDLEGEVDLTFPILPDLLRRRVEALRGERTMTDGALTTDLTVTVVEPTGEKSYHFEFRLGLIVLGEDVLLRLVKKLAGVAADVSIAAVGVELVALADRVDPGEMGDALAEGMRGLAEVLPKVAAAQTYDGLRAAGEHRRDISADPAGHPGAGMVLAHFGRAMGKGMVKVGARVAGVSAGAAVAAALSAPGGAGAVLGAAGLSILGRFVYRKATVDVPMAYRLARIRRLADALRRCDRPGRAREELERKLQKQQEHVLRRIRHEIRTDKFSFLDELADRVEKRPEEEKHCYRPLVEAVAKTLRFQALAHSDRLFALKLAQLERAFAGPGPR